MARVKIGWASRCISIDDNLCLFGQMYLRISQGIMDPNMTTALVLDSGEGHVIFCSCDIEAHRGDSIQRTIGKVVALRPEIDPHSIVMNVTHTHTAGSICETDEFSPDGIPLYDGLKYREFVAQQSAEAIVEAWDNRREGGVAFGYGYAVTGHSRRVVYSEDMSVVKQDPIAPNGHALMYGKTNDPLFRHFEAGADHFVNLLYTFDRENSLTGILVNVACPSQCSGNYIMQSADFWNEVREAVKKRYGQQVSVLPQCAAAGDLSPRILHYSKAQARRMGLKYGLPYTPSKCQPCSQDDINRRMAERMDIADQLMGAVEEVLGWASRDIRTQPVIRCLCRELSLTRRIVTEEEKAWCEDTLEQLRRNIPDPNEAPEEYRKALSYYHSIEGRNSYALTRYAQQKTDRTLPCTVHVVRLDEIAFNTCPYEIYMDYMHRIQARSPFLQTFMVQLCSGPGGTYLATERGRQNKGYSASLFCNFIGPEGGQELVEATLELLKELAAE